MMWTLADGIAYIVNINPKLQELGYHPGLMGSVLTNGQSDNDLDVAIIPYDNDETHQVKFVELLSLLSDLGADRIQPEGSLYGFGVYKEIWKLEANGKRIDFFIFFEAQ